MLFVVTLFLPGGLSPCDGPDLSEGCSRVSCESALASVVLSVSSDRLETIRDDLYCDLVFHPDALFPCGGPGLVSVGVLE